jgi:hypothetical protein
MTTTAWWVLQALAGVVGTFIVLWIATHVAWIKASGIQLLGLAGAIQVVSAIPKIGWLLAVFVFFFGLTRYFGANAMEATYVFFMALLVQFGLALFVFAR